jgi:cysteine desulfurase
LFSGGGQERGLRSGTLPAALIVGFGEACRLAAIEMAAEAERIGGLRSGLLERLRRDIPGIQVNGSVQARIAGNLNLTFPRATAADLMDAVPELCVSTGSACSSAAIEPSYVLRALGLSDREAERTLRIGIGRFTSPADIDYAAAALSAAHAAGATANPEA